MNRKDLTRIIDGLEACYLGNEEFYLEVWQVSEMMKREGGSFVSKLGELLSQADYFNAKKIKATWPEYWQQYLELGKKIDAELKKLNQELVKTSLENIDIKPKKTQEMIRQWREYF